MLPLSRQRKQATPPRIALTHIAVSYADDGLSRIFKVGQLTLRLLQNDAIVLVSAEAFPRVLIETIVTGRLPPAIDIAVSM
jgi:hypothetical protein